MKMRTRGKLPKDGRIMCMMPSDREEKFLVGRTLLDPAKQDLFSDASKSDFEERKVAWIGVPGE